MDASAVVPTEDAVQTLIDFLVDPHLSLRSSKQESPSLDKMGAVAKQMHAVVLLYNYYHRRNFRQLEFLDFESFCKMSVIAKPSLLMFMKLMQIRGKDQDQLDKPLSVTEQMIMDACNICLNLDPSKDAPNMEGWTISKVAVFVVDPMKEKCFLEFSSVTDGVWSLIEKNLDEQLQLLEGRLETRSSSKRTGNSQPCGDKSLQLHAFSAIKEKTGIQETNLVILESHSVYSLSVPKSMSRFYIVHCTETFGEELTQVPIEDVIESLKGPMFTKCVGCFSATSVVEYFHLLPYIDIISDWFFRLKPLGRSQLLLEQPGNDLISSSEKESFISEVNGGSGLHSISESSEVVYGAQKERTIAAVYSSGPVQLELTDRGQHTTPDLLTGQSEEAITQRSSRPIEIGLGEKAQRSTPAEGPCHIETLDVKLENGDNICDDLFLDPKEMPVDHILLAGGEPTFQNTSGQCLKCDSMSPSLDQVEEIFAQKERDLLQAALSGLHRKRAELHCQQRHLEDQIAQCEKNIQTLIHGRENDLKLKLESIIEAFTDAHTGGFSQCRAAIGLGSTEQHSPQCFKRKRLSEAILTLQNPCQELDDICCENYWMLPKYNVIPSDGGFIAHVSVGGPDFECPVTGDTMSSPRLARESAATLLLAQLRTMACKL